MIKRLNFSNLTLLIITLTGTILRFYHLENNPPSLNWDEVSHGYNAFSILTTGKDEWGVTYPLIFKAFGDYKLPAYIYATILPEIFFGITALSVRFISALSGSLAIPLIYFLTNKIFLKKITFIKQHELSLGHLSAFILALLPWHFFISRPALEANLAITLIIAGFLFLFRSLESSKNYLIASILLSLSVHTYNTARVFVPALLIFWIFLYKDKIKINFHSLISAAITVISLVIIINQIISGVGTARFSKLSILSESTVYQIGQDRTNSQLPPTLSRLIHNRPIYFITQFIPKYLSYFSPQFLYQSKGANYQFAIPYQNLLTLPVTALLIVGFIFLLKNIKNPNHQFILFWFFLSPLAASLTVDYPHALRTCIMIPSVVIIAAVGWKVTEEKFEKKTTPIIGVLITIFFIQYLSIYFNQYRSQYSDSWQYGYQEAVTFTYSHRFKYKNIFITKKIGEPHIFYAFFNKIKPKEIWPGDNNIRFEKSGWFWTDKIDNTYFINSWNIPNNLDAQSLKLESGPSITTNGGLLITTPDQLPKNIKIIKTINDLNNQPFFIIAEFI